MEEEKSNSDDFDTESQSGTLNASDSTDASGPKKPRKVCKNVGMNMSKICTEQFLKEYGFHPILKVSQTMHQHPHSAWQRSHLEQLAFKAASAARVSECCIADVGSGARVVRLGKHFVHCMCPHIMQGDLNRMSEAKRIKAKMCTHRLQECDCGPFEALVFVHSAYYFTTEELVHAISQTASKTAYVVGHVFEEAYGSLNYNEASYEVGLLGDRPVVTMKVVGNAFSYVHPPLPWDGDQTPYHSPYTVDVETLNVMGDSRLWRLSLRETLPPVVVTDNWEQMVVDRRHSGPICVPGNDAVTMQSLAKNVMVEVPVDRVYGWGPLLFASTSSGNVVLPKGALGTAQAKIAYRPRDAATFADVVHSMRSSLSSSRMPENMRVRALTIGSALAFQLNVQNETDLLNTLTGRFSWVWRVHSKLTSLTPLRIWGLTQLILVSILGLLVVGLIYFEAPYHRHIVGLGAFVVWLVITILITTAMCCARLQQLRSGRGWSNTLFHENTASNITGGIVQPLLTRFPASNNFKPPAPVDEHTKLIQTVDRHEPIHPSQQAMGLIASGAVLAQSVPTVPASNVDSELSALTHRVLTPPTTVELTPYKKFLDFKSRPGGRRLLKIKIKDNAGSFERWVNQKKFSSAQKELFRKLYAENQDKPPSTLSNHQYASFVKIEKSKVTTVDGDRPIKPRLIQGPSDIVKCMCGPAVASIYGEVLRAWDGLRCRLFYASGKTPAEVGSVIDKFVYEKCGGWDNVVAIVEDAAVFDASCQNELLVPVRDLYIQMGMSPTTYAWLKQASETRGITRHGVIYKPSAKTVLVVDPLTGVPTRHKDVPRQEINSGQMDTNLVGTLINGLAHESGLPDMDYLCMVAGDDALTLIRKDQFDPGIVPALNAHMKGLGLTYVGITTSNRFDMEFCSRLLWEGVGPDGVAQTVLGAKPGRCLSRAGWTVNTPGEVDIKSAIIGQSLDNHHVPLLGVYFDRLELILRPKSIKAKGKEYSNFLHLTQKYESTALDRKSVV